MSALSTFNRRGTLLHRISKLLATLVDHRDTVAPRPSVPLAETKSTGTMMRRRNVFSNESGATAVEFAMVAPIFLVILLGIVSVGYIFGVHHELRQLAAEAARASVAGISNAERESLATGYVSKAIPSYSLLSTRRMTMTTQVRLAPAPSFHVVMTYDLSGTFPYQLGSLLPMPSPRIEKRAVVGLGGY